MTVIKSPQTIYPPNYVINNNYTYFVLHDAAVAIDGDKIKQLFVKEFSRRQGIGTELIQTAEKHIFNNYNSAVAYVNPANAASINLFFKNNYKLVGAMLKENCGFGFGEIQYLKFQKEKIIINYNSCGKSLNIMGA